MKNSIAILDAAHKRRFNRLLAEYHAKKGALKVSSLPPHLHIDVTNSCNLHCPFCVNKLRRDGNETAGTMSFKQFKYIVDLLRPYLVSINFGDKSEPTLNKDLYRMIDYASHKYNIVCHMNTNFNIFSKEKAREMISSRLALVKIGADGATQKTYAKYRIGGNLARVLANIRLLQRLKKVMGSKNPAIRMIYVGFKHNERELPKAKKIAKKLGIEFSYLPGEIFNIDKVYKDWLPKNPKYSRYIIQNTRVNGKKALKISNRFGAYPCCLPWKTFNVDANGFVYICCHKNDANYSAGNIFKDRFEDIWNGRIYKDARSYLTHFKTSRNRSVPCLTCNNLIDKPEIYYPGGEKKSTTTGLRP